MQIQMKMESEPFPKWTMALVLAWTPQGSFLVSPMSSSSVSRAVDCGFPSAWKPLAAKILTPRPANVTCQLRVSEQEQAPGCNQASAPGAERNENADSRPAQGLAVGLDSSADMEAVHTVHEPLEEVHRD